MTRRIAIAILLTTWAALIFIGVGIYVATRHTLLADLDDSIVARAMALPRGYGISGSALAPSGLEDDRYVIRNSIGQTLTRPTTSSAGISPIVRSQAFSTLADGSRLRTITLDIGTDPGNTATVVYSTSASRFDRLLNQLVIWLVGIGLFAGLCAAAAAVIFSRIALRPLLKTAQAICDIDERSLDRRIEDRALPAELLPMAARLNEMLARLEIAFDQRTRFLADASHELRTPVAALMTTIEVCLRLPRTAAEMVEILETCLSDAKLLRQLVDRLMQQVRGESTASGETIETFDLVQLLNECVDSVIRGQTEKSLIVRRRLPDRLLINTERDRIRGIVTNLLSNAFEYTPGGGMVDLDCSIGNELVISVSDNGKGIPAELIPRLFTPFARGDHRRSTVDGHLGLGLSIVQAHAKALRGRCVLEPVSSTGAVFRVFLPASCVILETPEAVTK